MMVHAYVEKVAEKHGWDVAGELARFQAAQVYAMKDVALKENLQCDALLTRCFETMLSQSHANDYKKMYERHLKLNLDYINDVNFVDSGYVETASPNLLYFPPPPLTSTRLLE